MAEADRAGTMRHAGLRAGLSALRSNWRGLDLEALLEVDRDRLFLWLPVSFAAGIAAYFALPVEPPLLVALLLAAVSSLFLVILPAGRPAFLLAVAFTAAAVGFLDAKVRTFRVAAPVVQQETGVATIEGTVESFERQADGSARLLLVTHAVEDMAPEEVPYRISLRVRVRNAFAEPGDVVRLAGVLLPPPDASEPGGFDYARQIWFERIGAVGYAVSAPETIGTAETSSLLSGVGTAVERIRAAIAQRIESRIEGEAGGIAAALVTGLRGGIPDDAQEALRASGLAHILAISGLHMMLVVGALFWGVRAMLALSARLALTKPIKKWAAVAALIGGGIYLVLSGGSIATQRAFIMAAIMLAAILLDRPAITLRNVAIAALIVLALTPEAVMSASFQMSFAATTALVAGYEAIRARPSASARVEGSTGFLRRHFWPYLLGLMMTALIAGLATAPYAAYHFNRVAMYGLVGNVLAMPLVGTIVMPAGLIAMCLMPIGLDPLALWIMGQGIDAVLAAARMVAGWNGAIRVVPAFGAGALGMITLGGLWLMLWRGAWRLWGLAGIATGVAIAAAAPQPDLFVSRNARMAALRTDDGGLVFLPRASSRYVAERWLRAAGDPRRPGDDSLSDGRRCDPHACVAASSRLSVALVRHPAAFEEECLRADVVVAQVVPPAWCVDHALVIGPREAEALGAATVRVSPDGFLVDSVAGQTGARPWSRRTGHESLDPP